jgi:hypothetical protein
MGNDSSPKHSLTREEFDEVTKHEMCECDMRRWFEERICITMTDHDYLQHIGRQIESLEQDRWILQSALRILHSCSTHDELKCAIETRHMEIRTLVFVSIERVYKRTLRIPCRKRCVKKRQIKK